MITAPFAFTRRFYEPQEVIISSCNSCFSTVGESPDEFGLEILEGRHSCAPSRSSSAAEQCIEHDLFVTMC